MRWVYGGLGGLEAYFLALSAFSKASNAHILSITSHYDTNRIAAHMGQRTLSNSENLECKIQRKIDHRILVKRTRPYRRGGGRPDANESLWAFKLQKI